MAKIKKVVDIKYEQGHKELKLSYITDGKVN